MKYNEFEKNSDLESESFEKKKIFGTELLKCQISTLGGWWGEGGGVKIEVEHEPLSIY